MFKTIGHHTISDTKNPDKIEASGPFKAEGRPYLGEGYYFWDNHIELAHWWGYEHYSNSYMICESKIEASQEDFFDLVGSREDQIYLIHVREKFNLGSRPLGAIIDFLRELAAHDETKRKVFPFNVVRAMDVYHRSKFDLKRIILSMRSGTPLGITNLAPKMFICIFKKNNPPLRTFKVIYPESYVSKSN